MIIKIKPADSRYERGTEGGQVIELVDTDDSGIVTESEMIAAQNEGLLPVEDI